MTSATLAERLWAKVAIGGPDECWPWQASVNAGGYGQISVGDYGPVRRGPMNAHRAAFFLVYGELPPVVRHTCDNPPCCNPAHLLGGTQGDNVIDAVVRERHGLARLNWAKVAEIRRRAAGGEPLAALAREFAVSPTSVGNVVHRRTWVVSR